MPERPFYFEVYRLNVVDDDAMLPFMPLIRTDADILRVLSASTESRFDQRTESRRGAFKWSASEFTLYNLTEVAVIRKSRG